MPLTQLAYDARRVRAFCDLLEALADELPRRTPALWREAWRLSVSALPQHFQLLNVMLLPYLSNCVANSHFASAALGRLRRESEDCAAGLQELADLLDHAGERVNISLPAEALGYALRGYFGDIRRHIAWEEDFLLPLARQYCGPRDLTAMEHWLRAMPSGRADRLFLVASEQKESAPRNPSDP